MKKFALFFILLVGFGGVVAQAMPRTAHGMNGVVQAVDQVAHVVRLEPAAADDPVAVEIVAGRTVLRANRQPAELADLQAGQAVHIYYQRESGRVVATEVSWTTPPPPREKPQP